MFVSYRREDTRHVAGRLADRLVERFQVFMDMDTIEPGSDFTDVIQEAVNGCDVFLPVIGTRWTSVADEHGRRRLDDPGDWVASEIAIALQRKVPVIPVLVDGAEMPSRAELPEALSSLASRQAMIIRHESFPADVARLVSAIEKRLGTTVSATAGRRGTRARQTRRPSSGTTPRALAAFFGQRYEEAVGLFERVLRQQPDHPGAADRLGEARRHVQLSTWNAQADQAAAEGRWADAVVQLENVRSLDPDYPDLARRLQAATRQRRAGDLQADVRALASAGQWAAVLAAGHELAGLDPARADPDGLVSRARTAMAEAALAERYARGLTALDRDAPAAAMEQFEAVLRERADYRDAAGLHAEARRRVLAGLYATAGTAEAAGRLDEAADALRQVTELDPANLDAARRLRALRGRRGDRPRMQPTPRGVPDPGRGARRPDRSNRRPGGWACRLGRLGLLAVWAFGGPCARAFARATDPARLAGRPQRYAGGRTCGWWRWSRSCSSRPRWSACCY